VHRNIARDVVSEGGGGEQKPELEAAWHGEQPNRVS
jgi:hypothetical protein